MSIPFVVVPEMYEVTAVDGDYIRDRMGDCSTKKAVFGHIGEEDCDHFEEKYVSCGVRICPRCEGNRRARASKKYKLSLDGFKRVSVLTLTYKGHHPLNRETKRRLERDIRNFIKRLCRVMPSDYDLQYIRVLEIVEKFDGYYYHNHILIDLPYIEQKELSQMWGEVTGGSYVVWIESLKTDKGEPIGMKWGRLPKSVRQSNISNYLTKYLAKPLPLSDADAFAEFGYGVHFVESRLTSIMGRNSSMEGGVICGCGVQMRYLYTYRIGGEGVVT